MSYYIMPLELKSQTKLWWRFYVSDLFFIIGYVACFQILNVFVDERLRVFYILFNILMAVLLTLPSPYNKQKHIYQSLHYLIIKDRHVYHPIAPPEKPMLQGDFNFGVNIDTPEKEVTR